MTPTTGCITDRLCVLTSKDKFSINGTTLTNGNYYRPARWTRFMKRCTEKLPYVRRKCPKKKWLDYASKWHRQILVLKHTKNQSKTSTAWTRTLNLFTAADMTTSLLQHNYAYLYYFVANFLSIRISRVQQKMWQKHVGLCPYFSLRRTTRISQLPKLCVKISILRHRRMWVRSSSTRLTSVTFADDNEMGNIPISYQDVALHEYCNFHA